MPSNLFKFRHFEIIQEHSPARIGTDGTLLGAWAHARPAERILDVGTGTGLIALMMAQRNPSAQIIGVEKHPAAAEEARLNFEQSPWADRLELFELDFREFPNQRAGLFDLIISNPPFFRDDLKAESEDRNSWRKQAHLGIDELIGVAAGCLSTTGRLALVLPVEGMEGAVKSGADCGLTVGRCCAVHFKPEKPAKRVLLELSRQPGNVEETKLVIQTGGRHEYSEDYIRLTRDFYPWME